MPRIRTLKPELPQSESMGRISREARLLFISLFTLADDAGRLRGSSRMLASLLYPYDDDAPGLIDTWMVELEGEACVRRYKCEGDTFLEICNWLKHQKIDKPSPSKLPPFAEDSRIVANVREESPLDQGSRIKDQGRDHDHSSASGSDEPPAAGVVELPIVDGTNYAVSKRLYETYISAYPALDVNAEIISMKAWLLSNPANRKTRKGMPRFVNGWLSKAQNRAPRKEAANLNGNTTFVIEELLQTARA